MKSSFFLEICFTCRIICGSLVYRKNILSKIRMYFLNSKISKFLLFYNSKTKVIFIYIYININDIFQN